MLSGTFRRNGHRGPPVKKVVGYIRVSTLDQADGFGPDIQEASIRQWFGDRHRRLTFCRDIGVSGKLLHRPGLADALRELGKGDTLVVARLDRLARDLIVQELLLADIRRRGARLASCVEGENAYLTDNPDDPSRTLIRQVLGAVSEYERAMVKLRLSVGRRAKRAGGGYAGGVPPFGMRHGAEGGLEEDEREQEVLRTIRALADEGYGPTFIADHLNAFTEHHPRRAARWRKQDVYRVLSRDRVTV